ncbi:MAG TPA: tetratricopeptide repeat protein [Cyclobacteriaceae bacterium]|nr:tetratricopeptide repeat protein [Cyclobacteriaceae bacterium]HMV08396.1 tetratricopeptide repeat protein [Cyclobacteriaceae bacterium]HMV89677.1 tetratricopeptide repeat protein [Cyclobacteriaceae bacterium]HMX01169.1 tetratricopeptide repeat protein [Cyclobacteriaceae bacterium]HMX50572.1 tetratricopeptide repeat protein [Cyclobacteriaceae bacterium]
MISRILCSLLLCLGLLTPSVAQTDSLLKVLDTAKNDRKVKVLNELFRANLASNPVKAIGYTREALNLATEINDQKGVAASYNNLGVAYKNQGALDKALEYYIRSLKIYETLDNKEGIATTKNNIATIYSIKGDYGQAMKYLEESYNQLIELKDESRLVGSLNNLGNLHIDLQLYEKASEYFQKAYQLSEKLGQPFADPMNNLGNVFFRQGNYQRAIDFYQKALEIEQKENNRLGMLGTITNIGIAYTKANQPKPAMQYLNEAHTMAKDLQAYRFVPDILRNQADNQFRLGDVKSAYKTLLKYDSAREKVFGEESSRNIAQMEMALSLQEKEKEFEMLKKEAEIKTLELNNTRLFITLLVLIVIIVLAVINFYYMGRRRKFLNKTQ